MYVRGYIMKLRFWFILLAIFVVVTPSSNVIGFLSEIPEDLPKVLFRSYEFDSNVWESDGEVTAERNGVSFYIKDLLGSGYSFKACEWDNRDVFVSAEIDASMIDPMSIGTLVSDNGMLVYWSLTTNYLYINFTLTSCAEEEFSVRGFEAIRYKWDYGYREKFRSFVHGNSVRFDIKCDNSTPNVVIDVPKNFEYYGKNVSVTGRGVLIKYVVAHDFKYPITEDRANDVWFEVRDIDTDNLQVVVHFTKGISGDFVLVLNPVWYDYVTIVPLLELFGWTEPVASLGVGEVVE